ncbi:hypothetical protein MSPP1_003533 [Malassezia sp. CBS 17886]|nr:hypothetical protein MSPP1_003533 [Malassezia sp. CBS 17886]
MQSSVRMLPPVRVLPSVPWTPRALGAGAVRAYATAPQTRVYREKVPRILPYQERRTKLSDRKAFLYAQYERLLSESELVLLFAVDRINVPLMAKLRHRIATTPLPADVYDALRAKSGGAPWELPVGALTMLRTGVMRPLVREADTDALRSLGQYLQGNVAMLTCPVLAPEYVGRVLRAVHRALQQAADEAKAADKQSVPMFVPLVAVVERTTLLEPAALPAFARTPTLATLRAQLVGLLSSPGQQLAGVLSQAQGATLAATLDARCRDLGD